MNLRTLTAGLLVTLQAPALPDTLTLAPVQDNTLYESALGNLSNGKGVHFFAGVNGSGQIRRALLRFDVAGAVPAGSTITAVELQLFMSKTSITSEKDVSLHRVLAAWGEGASDAAEEEGAGAFAEPGDATWLNTFYPVDLWSAAGGDFEPVPSATLAIGPVGPYVWAGTIGLSADVQLWLDQPQANHGWCVLGAEGGGQSAKRFDAREHPDPAARPALVVHFAPPGGCTVVQAALEAVRLGEPENPLAFLPGQTSGPVLGAVWDPVVDHASFAPDAILDVVAVSPFVVNLPTSIGTILCDVSLPWLAFTSAPGVPFALAVPDACALAGVMVCTQAASVAASGWIGLTNALDLTVGTF